MEDDKASREHQLPIYASQRTRRHGFTFTKLLLAAILLITSTMLLYSPPPLLSLSHKKPHHPPPPPVNIILMISDGYGPASHTMARTYYRLSHLNDSIPEFGWRFPLDAALVGSHRSRSSNSLITDSAAGATAFSCGKKSYNGGIAVDAEGKACKTVFEEAKEKGYLTGVVVTSRLTDATPAAFYAHVASRSQESSIASQMLEKPDDDVTKGEERTIDLAIGGGGCFFLPKSDPLSCRNDDRDLVAEATEAGWDVRLGDTMLQSAGAIEEDGPHGETISRPDAGDSQTPYARHSTLRFPRLPFLSLLSPSNTPYVVDIPADAEGKTSFPTLAELSEQALHALSKGRANIHEKDNDGKHPHSSCMWSRLLPHLRHGRGHRSRKHPPAPPKPFILMIEGSQIDLCQHENDAGCMVREAVAYQEAAALVIDYVDKLNAAGRPTLLVSTSDHETGGLTLGRQLGEQYPEYAYYPERLKGAKASAGTLSARLLRFVRGEEGQRGEEALKDHIAAHILGEKDGLGLGNEESGGPVTDEEVDRVMACLHKRSATVILDDGDEPPPIDNGDECRKAIAEVASRRAQVGWSSSGHTGVDINLYAYGHGAEGLRGNIENTDVSRRGDAGAFGGADDDGDPPAAQIGKYFFSLLK